MSCKEGPKLKNNKTDGEEPRKNRCDVQMKYGNKR